MTDDKETRYAKRTRTTQIGEDHPILSKYRTKDGFETYDKLTTADRNALKGPITTLAEDLAQLRGILGLD